MYQSQPPRKNNDSPQHVPIQREEVIRSPQTESFSPDKEMFASGTGTAQLMALQKVLGNRGTMQRVRAEQQANALIQRAAEEEAGDMDELEAMMQPQEMEGAAEAPSGAIPVQRMEAEDAPEADELEALLQAQEVDEGTTSDDMPVQRAVEAVPSSVELPSSAATLNQTGMPDALKSGIESMSGMDMSDVRVHYNSREPDKVNAHAYAQGSDIHLAPGQDQHLPHEAWHVVQQRQGRVQPTMQLESGVSINDDAGLEQEATDMGTRALSEGVTQRRAIVQGSNVAGNTGKLTQAKWSGKTIPMQLMLKKTAFRLASSAVRKKSFAPITTSFMTPFNLTATSFTPVMTPFTQIVRPFSTGVGGLAPEEEPAKSFLPNFENASIDSKKLTHYALSTEHPKGKHKARVFERVLGYNQSNADHLKDQIKEKLSQSEAVLGKLDEYGQRYTVAIKITGPNGNTAIVITAWIIEPSSDIPKMTTLYVE